MQFKFLAVAAAAFLAAPLAANAQEQAEARPAWVKVCNADPNNDNRQLCLTSQELRSDDGRFLASVALREIEGDETKNLVMAVPPGMLIKPGVRIQVDENDAREGEYAICFPNACYAEMEIDAAYIDTLKAGTTLNVTMLNQQGKGVQVPLTLAGFTSVYEGEPIDAAALEQQQERLQAELQRRAEEARQRLLEQQGNTTN